MGTAQSHTGSGGAWIKATDELVDWLDSLPEEPTGLEGSDIPTEGPRGTIDDEVPGPSGEDSHEPDGEQPDPSGFPDVPKNVVRGIGRALRSPGGNGGGVGGAMTGRPGSGSRGGGGVSGASRSSRVAGRVGGRTVAGVAALGRRDATTLAALGLSLDDLDALDSDYDRAARIADAAAEGAPTSFQDEELRGAAAQTAIWAQQLSTPPSSRELVEYFVAEYLYRILDFEFGARRRDGATHGSASLPDSRTLRSTVRAYVNRLHLGEPGSTEADISSAIESCYDRLLDIWTES